MPTSLITYLRPDNSVFIGVARVDCFCPALVLSKSFFLAPKAQSADC